MTRIWVLFLFVIVLLQMLQSSLGFTRCKKHELDALLKFKHSFTSDPMNRLSSWVGEDCCQWYGVTCDNVTRNVVKLNLRTQQYYNNNGVSHFYPCLPDDAVSMISSGVSSALLELSLLTHLDLSGNNFSKSPIPEFIGSMRHLRYLNLSSAGFSGTILSNQLGNLTNLVHLDLYVGQCYQHQSTLYGNDLGWLSALLKLKTLHMGGYKLSGVHDTFKVLNTLPFLLSLSLSYCQLNNSHLSEAFIGNSSNSFFPNLQHLDLGTNYFESPLPPVLKNMVSLRFLSVRLNNLNGSIPVWLRTMRHLEVLDLQYNAFSYVEGGIMGIMGNPCNFKYLDLSYNSITQADIMEDSISLSGCDAFDLQHLSLSNIYRLTGDFGNDISINLPSSLGQLTNLNYLDLSSNKFKGQVPSSFVNLSALKYLDLSNNQLSGLIPDFIGQLSEIEHIDISSNSIRGTVFGIGNLSKLSYLDMNYNHLNLDLNSSFNWQPSFQLQTFKVHSCLINTVFPQLLRNQTQIEYLDLSYTGISGELPSSMWNLSSIKELHLSGNQLTGSLPQHRIRDRSELMVLNLHDNLLNGTIPKWLCLLENIQEIILSSNRLSGEILDGNNGSSLLNIGDLLWVLDLSDNKLSGEIRFGNESSYARLEILSLRGNHFSGHIPLQLCNFTSLLVLELAHNRFTGHIPSCLGSIQFYGAYAPVLSKGLDLEIEVVVKGIVESYTGSYWTAIIDISCNYLVGTIPEELTSIIALYALNLSYNHLTGDIPEKIGNLMALESLDLSNNHLSGTIPESLASISTLSALNLSNNNLRGLIPIGSQLQTLDDPSIYANNYKLCGFPLSNNCTILASPSSSTNDNPTAGKNDVEKKDKYDKLWFILAVMSGVATGFWGVVGTLVINLRWRQAYFGYVEHLADRIYVSVKVKLNMFWRRFNENF